ncbi:hypothetical protein RJ640_015462 [Escallonia rubra]|uniref:Aluminum-activated malate transporter 8-like n=1 Tax=Escallonia rubra TaxID=112253 RepID=A0AA88URK7_9ASTE|nr:hypothetical protein RJ640_015462 [Escallonia rubra]
MEIISSADQGKTGIVARLKSVFGRLKAKAADVGKGMKKIGQDDPRIIVHSVKVALALTIVSLFYYFRPLYDGFGPSGMWAVLTVVVIFEFTVGATLSKALNRGLATFLAGSLGIGAEYLASLFGEKGEPIVLGFLVFLLAAASTFTRFFPHIKKKYDYGVLIFILTFSLVAVSGYRVEKIIELAHQRLSTIIIGGATCMIISIFLCPVWAGEELHNLIALNLEKLATFLEGFGGEYFANSEDGKSAALSKDDQSCLVGYRSILNTKATEESLANFAWWEPRHGQFRLRHPWKLYLKVAVLVRQCAYQIETLNGYINSELKGQGTSELETKIEEPCTRMSSESAKALKELASALKTMTHPSAADIHVQNCKTAVDDLKDALEAFTLGKSDLLEILPAVTVASILNDVSKCVQKIAESTHEISDLASFKRVNSMVAPDLKLQLLHRGSVKPIAAGGHVVIRVHQTSCSDSPEDTNSRAKKAMEV